MTELNLIPWPETQQFHQVRKYTHEYPEILNSKPVVKYRCKNKLDGSNMAIRLLFKDRQVSAQSREVVLTDGKDCYGFARWVRANKDKFVAWMDHFESKLKLQHEQLDGFLLYGEWCGPGIQSRCAVSSIDRKVFALFAFQPIGSTNDDSLVVDPYVLNSYFKDVCPDFYVIPWINDKEYLVDWSKSSEELQPITEELNAVVAEVEKCDPWVKSQFGIEGLGEGFVMFPVSVDHIGKKNFANLACKVKGEKHKTVAQKHSVQVEPETAATAQAFALLTLTLPRLEQGVRAVAGGEKKFEQKSVGAFLKWIATDVQKECQAELAASNLSWKDVQKSVGDFARNWYLAEMKK